MNHANQLDLGQFFKKHNRKFTVILWQRNVRCRLALCSAFSVLLLLSKENTLLSILNQRQNQLFLILVLPFLLIQALLCLLYQVHSLHIKVLWR